MAGTQHDLAVYSDHVCPFCYLGRKSLERVEAERGEPFELDWRPFDLRRNKRRPDGTIDYSVDDGKDDAYFEQVQENLDRLRVELGVSAMIDLDETPDRIDSLPAQLVSRVIAETLPTQWRQFDDALLAALWEDGRDIGDESVIISVAESVGVPVDAIREGFDDEARRGRLEEDFAAAARAGITGVPTFSYGERLARGAVPPARLERLVDSES